MSFPSVNSLSDTQTPVFREVTNLQTLPAAVRCVGWMMVEILLKSEDKKLFDAQLDYKYMTI